MKTNYDPYCGSLELDCEDKRNLIKELKALRQGLTDALCLEPSEKTDDEMLQQIKDLSNRCG